jgi:hypothetical protein
MRWASEREGHQNKEDFVLIQDLQGFLRDLGAFAVPRFWFRLVRVRLSSYNGTIFDTRSVDQPG